MTSNSRAKDRIQRRSILIITLAALLPLAIGSLLTLWLSFQATQRSAREAQLELSKLVARDFSQTISAATSQIKVFGTTLMSSKNVLELTNDRIFPLLVSNPIWSEIGYYDSRGHLRANAFHTTPSQLPLVLTPDQLDQVAQNGIAYEDPHQSGDNSWRMRLLLPIDGAAISNGLLVGELWMDQFWELNTILDQSSNSKTLIVTQNGQIISAGVPELVQAQQATIHNELITGEAVSEGLNLAGVAVLRVRTTIPETGWNVIVERPLDEIYADLNRLILNILLVIGGASTFALAVGWFAGRQLARPIKALHRSVEAFGTNPNASIEVDTSADDEISDLGAAFNTMAQRLRENQAHLSRTNEQLEQQVAERTKQLATKLSELHAANTLQEELIATIRDLGMPVVPITDDIIVMNLVGNITTDRASDIINHLLKAVEAYGAKIAIIDVTGISMIDTTIARSIMNAVSAAKLLGTDVIMVGIRPEMAQTLTSLAIEFRFTTAPQLAQGFVLAQARLGK